MTHSRKDIFIVFERVVSCAACLPDDVDITSSEIQVFEFDSRGWTAPVVCGNCKRSLPVYVDDPAEDYPRARAFVRDVTLALGANDGEAERLESSLFQGEDFGGCGNAADVVARVRAYYERALADEARREAVTGVQDDDAMWGVWCHDTDYRGHGTRPT